MNSEEKRTATQQLLIKHYNNPLNSEDLPERRERSKWTKENKFGFLLGMAKHGQDFLVTELYNNLSQLQEEDFEKEEEEDLFGKMYDFHIKVFKQHNGTGSSCHTPTSASRSNSAEYLDGEPYGKELVHKDLKIAVEKRDGVCLFCWNQIQCQAAHIVAQKEVPFTYDEPTLFERTGLNQKHQVQNGLLLCAVCHGEFDALKRYVDVVDEKLVVKVVNETNDTTSDKHRDWQKAVRNLIAMRTANEEDWNEYDNRQAVEPNGEMALYFAENNPTNLPNRQALEFHKTACLIWRMAGGAEPDEEYCSDDEDLGPVDTAALKRRFKVQDSTETLHTVS